MNDGRLMPRYGAILYVRNRHRILALILRKEEKATHLLYTGSIHTPERFLRHSFANIFAEMKGPD
jgi:hypothetical protein